MNKDKAEGTALGYAWASEDITEVLTKAPAGEPYPRGDLLFAQAYTAAWDAYNTGERSSGPQPVRLAYARWQKTDGRTIESESDERLAAMRAERDAGRPQAYLVTREIRDR